MFEGYPGQVDIEELSVAMDYLADHGVAPGGQNFQKQELWSLLETRGCQKIATARMPDHYAAQAEILHVERETGASWEARETAIGWTEEIALTILLSKAIKALEG